MEPWAQLVSVTELDSSAISITKDKFVIGRSNDCDLPHSDSKRVSGKHCYIERDGNGKVWLYDTSTNGTLLNLSIKITKGQCWELHHGDEIHIVHKKDDTKDDIGYMFQDMEALRAETSSELEDTEELTQVIDDSNATIADEDVNTVTTPSPLKRRKSTDISPVPIKKVKTDPPVVEISPPTDDVKRKVSSTHAIADTSDKTSDKTDKTSCTSETKQEQNKLSGKLEEKTEPKLAGKPVVPEEPEDAFAESLVCIICQELLYDCISLQPCMHSFCAGCYSEWMERSQECPSCRMEVARINKNHIVNNLVEAYLKTRPDKKRPEADIKELQGKNKITRDMLYPAQKPEGYSDSYNDESYYDNSYDLEEEEPAIDAAAAAPVVPFNNFNNYNQGGMLFGIGTPYFGAAAMRPAQPLCRQCRGYQNRPNEIAIGPIPQGGAGYAGAACGDEEVPGPSTTAGPITVAAAVNDPDVKTFPTAPDYQCPGNCNHVLCLCCMQPMPDRRHQYVYGGHVPPQQCFLCLRSFCHAYWGCHNANCNGCLAKFKDLNFGKKCLTSLVQDNQYESKVLADYLADQNISVKDVFKECLAKSNTGEYVFTNQTRITSCHGLNTPVCYGCGFQAFKEMAYFYRRDIPVDRLPKEVTSRPNCYWGKNCRTQRNKPEHAVRFNHICEQSRTNT